MILRTLTLAGGLTAAAATSQFPEFSQQYLQRLGGAVDALSEVAADFDASAAGSGLSRAAALDQLRGSEFLDRRRVDMTNTFRRLETLRTDLVTLQGQGPFMRAYHAARLTDQPLARATLAAYKPALPLTFAGALFAAAGFLAGVLLVGPFLRLLTLPFRRSA